VGRVGRPRASGPSDRGLDTRDEVLEAAAELFTEHGYAATSTRMIAERAGLRQASLYHHFAGKDDLLASLLDETVGPSLELAAVLARSGAAARVRLWALCHGDIGLLCAVRHNLGALYLLPELSTERFSEFRERRGALKAAYREFIAATTPDPEMLTDLVFGLVEATIMVRRDNPGLNPETYARHGADGALRLVGCPEAELPAIRAAARALGPFLKTTA
jgi:AcrR family transcriptional regulator